MNGSHELVPTTLSYRYAYICKPILVTGHYLYHRDMAGIWLMTEDGMTMVPPSQHRSIIHDEFILRGGL
jgi:hypothetical protein